VEIRDLECLAASASVGNFARAATALGCNTSTILDYVGFGRLRELRPARRSPIEGYMKDDVADEQGDTIGRPHPNQKGIVVSSPQDVFPQDFCICRW
jgi:hypothetical protein